MTEEQLLERLILEAEGFGATKSQLDRAVAAAEASQQISRETLALADGRLKIIAAADQQMGQLRVDVHNSRNREQAATMMLDSLVADVRAFIAAGNKTGNKKRALLQLQKTLANSDKLLSEEIPF